MPSTERPTHLTVASLAMRQLTMARTHSCCTLKTGSPHCLAPCSLAGDVRTTIWTSTFKKMINDLEDGILGDFHKGYRLAGRAPLPGPAHP